MLYDCYWPIVVLSDPSSYLTSGGFGVLLQIAFNSQLVHFNDAIRYLEIQAIIVQHFAQCIGQRHDGELKGPRLPQALSTARLR